jgi:RNA polymerase sigma factor (sigma-70 family)
MELRGTPTLADLVSAASRGDQTSWNALVDRFLPLVFSVARKYRLTDEDAADVSQTLWLRLVENLDAIKEPHALPSWIITTTKREAMRVLAARKRSVPVDATNGFDSVKAEGPEADAELLRTERHQALRDGLTELAPKDRELIMLFIADPPLSYREIAFRLNVPVGSIGPTRGRCLDKLRSTTSMRRVLPANLTETGVITACEFDCNDQEIRSFRPGGISPPTRASAMHDHASPAARRQSTPCTGRSSTVRHVSAS